MFAADAPMHPGRDTAGADRLPADRAEPPVSPRLVEDVAVLRGRWVAGAIGDAAHAAGYFLLWHIDRHGRRFASRLQRDRDTPDPEVWRERLLTADAAALNALLGEWLTHYRYLRICADIPGALRAWLQDDWPLRLTERIPDPREVLRLQAEGIRPVTLIGFPRAAQSILHKANGQDFLVHDLAHAWKFLHDPRQYRLQSRFFQWLQRALESGLFDEWLTDAAFAGQMDYLISDMNTHPVHGLKFLHAAAIECLLRREGRGSRERISDRARRALMDKLENLGVLGELPGDAMQALLRLAAGLDDAADARHIEAALL